VTGNLRAIFRARLRPAGQHATLDFVARLVIFPTKANGYVAMNRADEAQS
jgi:hypothetical protein